jgi:hypothetical protein
VSLVYLVVQIARLVLEAGILRLRLQTTERGEEQNNEDSFHRFHSVRVVAVRVAARFFLFNRLM